MKRFVAVAKWALLFSALIFVSIALFVTLVVAPRIRTKSGGFHSKVMRSYRAFLEDVGPEAQFESHTCGWHALRVIYKAYGLNPDEANLRFRLGVDVPANPLDGKSTGTLQPDLLRVLVQDGFAYERLPLDDEVKAANALEGHVQGGHMAAVLIRRRENGNMHWVAVRKGVAGQVTVLDSLFPEAYPEQSLAFVRECVLSGFLISPRHSPKEVDDVSLWDGSNELLSTIERFRGLRKARVDLPKVTNQIPAAPDR
jgi:hypothetical protein